MVYKKLIIKNTKKYLKEFSDLVFPRKVLTKKMGSEVQEHFAIIAWTVKKVFLLVAIIYVLTGLLAGVHVFDSLFLGLLIFLYSNFLPDADVLFKKLCISEKSKLYAGYAVISKKGKLLMGFDEEAKWYEKYALLFFAPLFVYYRIFQKTRQLYTMQEKPFHNMKSLFAYSSFLLLIGFVFYTNILENVSLSLFGGFGYYIHLFIDRNISWK